MYKLCTSCVYELCSSCVQAVCTSCVAAFEEIPTNARNWPTANSRTEDDGDGEKQFYKSHELGRKCKRRLGSSRVGCDTKSGKLGPTFSVLITGA